MNKAAYSIVMSPSSANISETRDPLYIVLEDLEINLEWTKEEVREMDKYLKSGATVNNIRSLADYFNRTHEETFLLMIDRKANDLIAQSEGIGEEYIALESINMNFFWNIDDVHKFERLYKSGENIFNIAKILNRKEIDVVVLTIDRALRGSLEVIAS